MPFTGFDTTWSVKPAASAPYLPDYDPDSASTGTAGRPARKRSTSASRRARAAPINVPGANLKTVLELAQKTGHEGRRRLDRRDHRRDPGGARLAHLPARLPGPGRHGRLPAGDEGRRRPRLDRRAGGRPQGRRAPRRRPQPLHADDRQRPDAGKTVVQSAQAKGYRYVTDADGLSTVANGNKPVLGLFNTGNMSLEWSGPAAATGKGNAAGRLHRGPAPGQRAEPGGDDQAGDRPARRRQAQGVLPPGRGCLDRQAGPRDQRLRPDRRDGRLRPGDRRRARLPGRPPGHAGRRHRRPLAHEPDRRRGRERHGPADRLLDQPADQGRADAEPDLRHRRLRRPGRGAGRRCRRASSTPARSSRSGPAARAASTCSGPTTTPTCSRRWAARRRRRQMPRARWAGTPGPLRLLG